MYMIKIIFHTAHYIVKPFLLIHIHLYSPLHRPPPSALHVSYFCFITNSNKRQAEIQLGVEARRPRKHHLIIWRAMGWGRLRSDLITGPQFVSCSLAARIPCRSDVMGFHFSDVVFFPQQLVFSFSLLALFVFRALNEKLVWIARIREQGTNTKNSCFCSLPYQWQ